MKNLLYIICLLFIVSCGKEGNKPFCTITSPANNSEFKKGDIINVTINASDDDGMVQEVGLVVDNQVIGNTISEPFVFELPTTDFEMGEHLITIYAVDNEGLNSSASVRIKIVVLAASVSTDTITEISYYSAKCSAQINDNGGGPVLKKGFCWNTSPHAEITDFSVEIEGETNTFTGVIDSLESNTMYYVRSFAINESGISFGNETVFKTPFEEDIFVDSRDGTNYKTVKIAGKWWLAENLRYLPNVTVPTTGSDSVGYRYVYNQTSCGCMGKARANANYKAYGTLYNWTSAQESIPEGWHLPTADEWKEMADFIAQNSGNTITENNWENTAPFLCGKNGWSNGEQNNNNYGFSCLPGGKRDAETGNFINEGEACFFWSATETDKTSAQGLSVSAPGNNLESATFLKSSGYSVRCIKD